MAASSMESTIIGIDLGATNAYLAVSRNGVVEMISTASGSKVIPAVVAYSGAERLVGAAAVEEAVRKPQNTVRNITQLLGRDVDDPRVQNEVDDWLFKVVGGKVEPNKAHVQVGTTLLSPEQIAAVILDKAKGVAEKFLGHSVVNAVITVPAQCSDVHRHAFKDAGTIAGLCVRRIMDAPTAAALAYDLDRDADSVPKSSKRHVVVFHLGGETFEVSLLQISGGFVEVVATAGDSALGGADFDARVVSHMVRIFERKHKKDVTVSPRSMARLRAACEVAKVQLSSASATTVEIDMLFDCINFSETLTRARFEDLCADLFRAPLMYVEQVMSEACLANSDVDNVLLVGGSCHIPKIKKLVSSFFNGRDVCTAIDPTEAVALGAAVQGSIISGTRGSGGDGVGGTAGGTGGVGSGGVGVVGAGGDPVDARTDLENTATAIRDALADVNGKIDEVLSWLASSDSADESVAAAKRAELVELWTAVAECSGQLLSLGVSGGGGGGGGGGDGGEGGGGEVGGSVDATDDVGHVVIDGVD